MPGTNFPIARLRGPAGRRTKGRPGDDAGNPPRGSTADGTPWSCNRLQVRTGSKWRPGNPEGRARAAGTGAPRRRGGRTGPGSEQPEGRVPARAPRPAAAAAEGGGERGGRGGGKGLRAAARALTEWFTPHIRTLSSGSLARKSFTFCATKCFFLVLVLLAKTEDPRLPGVAMAAASVPLHRRAPEAGDPPSLHAGRGRQPHPAGAPCPLRPLRALGPAEQGGCARLAPRPGSRARRGSALSPRLDQARRERLPRWASAS